MRNTALRPLVRPAVRVTVSSGACAPSSTVTREVDRKPMKRWFRTASARDNGSRCRTTWRDGVPETTPPGTVVWGKSFPKLIPTVPSAALPSSRSATGVRVTSASRTTFVAWPVKVRTGLVVAVAGTETPVPVMA